MKLTTLKIRQKTFAVMLLCMSCGAVLPSAALAENSKWNMQAVQQQSRVSGIVKDETGEPVIGASVAEKGATNGVITGMDGSFSLTVRPDAVLVISYIGYVSQEVKSESGKTLEIILRENVEILDEVVVIGYGIQKKSNVTGAISSIKADDLMNAPISNAASALQGKVSGVQVVNNSGAPGATPAIRVRGYSSNGLSDPLYIVDGLKVGDISYLEPSSIKSMEILKDAASAAIYGAEAGNGVILITTKTGDKGHNKVLFDAQWIYSSRANKVDLLNAEQFTQYYREAAGDAFTSLYDQYNIAGANTDWQDEMYGTGKMQKYNVGVQGGNDSGNFFLSLGYMDNDGMVTMDRDYYQRITGQINADYKIKPWLEVGTSNTITSVKNSILSENDIQHGLMKDVLLADPLTPVFYDSDKLPERLLTAIANGLSPVRNDIGSYYGYSWVSDGITPLAAIQNNNETNRSFYINGMTYANLKPFKNFVFTTRLGYTLGNLAYDLYVPKRWNGYFKDIDTDMDMRSSQSTTRYYQWENFFNYMLETEKLGIFSIMAGMSYSNNELNVVGTRTNKLSSDAPNFIYMDYSTNDATDFLAGNLSYKRQVAYYGRLSWDYKNRYNVQANFRADSYDSAYLDMNHNWGYFPSISAGWTFSNERFMKNTTGNVFTFGKLRASYGINGSISNLGNYMYAATMRTGQYDLTNLTANMSYWIDGKLLQGIYPNSVLANPKLHWERSKQLDLGLDLRFLKDRMSVTVDYYNKLTDGLLVASVAPRTTGTSTVYQNLGKVMNSGLEVELEWKDKISNFGYGVKGNISTVKNKVKEYRGEGTRIEGARMLGASSYMTYFEEGYPLWYIRGYKMTGVNEATGEPVFADLTGDGEITDADRTELGKGIPEITYGLTLSASYKNFDFSIYSAGAYGNELIYGMMSTDAKARFNRPVFLYEGLWRSDNTHATMPAAVYQLNDSRIYNSDVFVFDASFLKIKQIQFGYTFTFPEKLVKSTGESLRIYVSLDNFFTFTDYPGSDPEINASSNTSSALAFDYGGYPMSKSVSFGFNVKF
jgi:TonB-linked SusC/RagA family outer membrane protein